MGNEETWESFLNLNLTSTSPYLLGLCFWSQSLRLLFPKMRIKPTLGLPGGSDGKESACNVGRPGFDPWVGKNPWRRAWQPTPVFLPGESPWTEEPGELQSMGSQRVRHNWATKHAHTLSVICYQFKIFFQLDKWKVVYWYSFNCKS